MSPDGRKAFALRQKEDAHGGTLYDILIFDCNAMTFPALLRENENGSSDGVGYRTDNGGIYVSNGRDIYVYALSKCPERKYDRQRQLPKKLPLFKGSKSFPVSPENHGKLCDFF